jgi:hypothetical protein
LGDHQVAVVADAKALLKGIVGPVLLSEQQVTPDPGVRRWSHFHQRGRRRRRRRSAISLGVGVNLRGSQ